MQSVRSKAVWSKAVWGAPVALWLMVPAPAAAQYRHTHLENGRGNGALQKLGATREGTLRKSFLRDGVYYDQVLWSIVADDWWTWMDATPARH